MESLDMGRKTVQWTGPLHLKLEMFPGREENAVVISV